MPEEFKTPLLCMDRDMPSDIWIKFLKNCLHDLPPSPEGYALSRIETDNLGNDTNGNLIENKWGRKMQLVFVKINQTT